MVLKDERFIVSCMTSAQKVESVIAVTADAVDGDAVAELRAFQDFMGLNGQADGIRAAVHMGNRPHFLNDASEHKRPPCWHYMP